ncbi:phage head closure protein [Marinobacter adhaerens]|uniref:Phage head closure protein n=1 Tax=Marinobacter adhaerens TaxID=1033846 RepID=A0A851HSB3_9GAMM|nr:phage head closure protein [Marinobacter adhaerens]NWN92294.1 phage head closure protein [Marinobacter adhaerens]
MRAGKLRHRVTIQKPGRTQDPVTGEITNGWSDVATVWASVEPVSVKEFIASQAGQSEITTRITMRYRDGINAKMRAVFRGKIYNIHGALTDPKSGYEYLTLPCSEGVNDGE